MSGMRMPQSGNGELDCDAKNHGKDNRNSCNAIGAIPENAIPSRAFIAKTIDGVRTHPSEDEG